MVVDSLQLQLTSALQRFAALQRRIEVEGPSPRLLFKAVEDLERALQELKVAQDQIVENRLRSERLHAELARERERYWRLFDEVPQPYLITGPDSAILEVNKAAAALLNVSQRFLVGKALSVFVGENRARFLAEMTRVQIEGTSADLTLRLRPRERAPIDVSARVQGDGATLRWILQPLAMSVTRFTTPAL